MSPEIYSPDSDYPRRTLPLVVHLREAWDDDHEWIRYPEIEAVWVGLHSGSTAPDGCRLKREYGKVKYPHESAPATHSPIYIERWWVRVSIAGEEDLTTLFVGKIYAETRMIHGADEQRSGVQIWQAQGPLRILQQIGISRSKWLVAQESGDPTIAEVGWLPPMNDRDRRGLKIGNRSADPEDEDAEPGIYLYGEPEAAPEEEDQEGDQVQQHGHLWTHGEYLQYLLANYVDELASQGPAWSLAGHTELLEDLSEVADFGETTTAAEIVRRLIRPERGLDFCIRYREKDEDENEPDGFEIVVFSLLPRDMSFGDHSLAANPDRLTIDVGEVADISCTVERSQQHAYGKVRVIGKQIVVACSLWGEQAFEPPFEAVMTLEKKWTATLENLYKAGTGNQEDPSVAHDAARESEYLQAVYSEFGAPRYWDLHDGYCAPALDESGYLYPIHDQNRTADYQRHTRSTLDWIPFYSNVDYSVVPALDHNSWWWHPDFLPPQAWIYNPLLATYVACDKHGIAIRALQAEWGVKVSCAPSHSLALNHWAGAKKTNTGPAYDYETLICTIAFHSDQRIYTELAIDDHHPSDGTLEVYVDDAEYWYAAPFTVVGLSDDAESDELVKTTGPKRRVLRDDHPRLLEMMSTTLARYYASRYRATITMQGYWPWMGMLGMLLAGVEDEGDTHEIEAAITSVCWQQNPPRTIVRTGYA